MGGGGGLGWWVRICFISTTSEKEKRNSVSNMGTDKQKRSLQYLYMSNVVLGICVQYTLVRVCAYQGHETQT